MDVAGASWEVRGKQAAVDRKETDRRTLEELGRHIWRVEDRIEIEEEVGPEGGWLGLPSRLPKTLCHSMTV